jgi:hypothetical protein
MGLIFNIMFIVSLATFHPSRIANVSIIRRCAAGVIFNGYNERGARVQRFAVGFVRVGNINKLVHGE